MFSALHRLLPRTHWSAYQLDGRPVLTIWRQWGSRCWNVTTVYCA